MNPMTMFAPITRKFPRTRGIIRLPRLAHVGAALLVALALQDSVAQERYPNRMIRIIVPTAQGGGSDTAARLIALELTQVWGRPVVVESRLGAGTIVGTEVVAKAPPDGYTLLMAPSAFASNPVIYKKLPYDTVRDFAPISYMLSSPIVLLVHPSVPVRSVRELIAYAKARPGTINYGSSGTGTNPHLSMELFASMAQINLVHIPYKGGAQATVDLLAGRISLYFSSSPPVVLPHIQSGKLIALGTTGARVRSMPDLPLISDAGLPGYQADQWTGLLAPAGTPRNIILALHKEATNILRLPQSKKVLDAQEFEVVGSTPDEFEAFLKNEFVKWAEVAKSAGIQPE